MSKVPPILRQKYFRKRRAYNRKPKRVKTFKELLFMNSIKESCLTPQTRKAIIVTFATEAPPTRTTQLALFWANIIKQKWSESSTSLRSRHIVDLALNESDRTPRSSASARILSPAIPGRVSPHLSPLSFKLSLQFKLPKTVKRPVAYSSVVYRRFEKPAPKIPMSASTCENV
ncbi:hypothetical protein EVAR_74404_1 [Eumeta japonica]|uniref:Uncharacterized protein n=1 Tax=Eumeta variegata TaxID=151549 RepID=A0A4C1SDK2_EUMVA|nr:hypothetical protein EVAR_74404_1 [Eumeta japonica]